MEREKLIESLKSKYTEMTANTIFGYWKAVTKGNLLSASATRSNTPWKKSEYVVAYISEDEDEKSKQDYIEGWKKNCKNYGNQYLFIEVSKDCWELYDGLGNLVGDNEYVSSLVDKDIYIANLIRSGYPIQKILFGSPGCGKSFYIKKYFKEHEIPDEQVFRTVFHPDTDYSSFVGAYKPYMKGSTIEYRFRPQVFTNAYIEAWNNPTKNIFLVIEEINRGNCAQIFGDLFQLLDRKNGYSEYPINADEDLYDYLDSKLTNKDGIKNKKLQLPPNFSIIATMNTSDQSLFPMDSAFKRRWDWGYMGIDLENEESKKYIIQIDGEDKTYKYSWHSFIKKINPLVKDTTKSEDKQLGTFFINGNIKEKDFISKVMFFLWFEICKDEYNTKGNFFRVSEEEEFTFNELYEYGGTKKLIDFMKYHGVEEV